MLVADRKESYISHCSLADEFKRGQVKWGNATVFYRAEVGLRVKTKPGVLTEGYKGNWVFYKMLEGISFLD